MAPLDNNQELRGWNGSRKVSYRIKEPWAFCLSSIFRDFGRAKSLGLPGILYPYDIHHLYVNRKAAIFGFFHSVVMKQEQWIFLFGCQSQGTPVIPWLIPTRGFRFPIYFLSAEAIIVPTGNESVVIDSACDTDFIFSFRRDRFIGGNGCDQSLIIV
jgi:hypothetical protein